MTKRPIALLLGASLLAACASTSTGAPAAPRGVEVARPLEGRSFTVTQIDGKAVTGVTLEFDKGRLSGRSGCNRYNAPVEVKGDGVFRVTGGVAMTMMACPPPAMDTEQAFSAALEQLDRWVLKGQTLELSGQGKLRIRATATP